MNKNIRIVERKDIIKQYKQQIPPMGIYQIRNLINGKILIGSSKNLHFYSNRHKFQLKLGSHKNKALQADYIKYGAANFVYEIIDFLPEKKDPAQDPTRDLTALEEMWLEKLQPYYNRVYHTSPMLIE